MQLTIMCPECARLLTVKAKAEGATAIVCPTCGWQGVRDEQGELTTTKQPD